MILILLLIILLIQILQICLIPCNLWFGIASLVLIIAAIFLVIVYKKKKIGLILGLIGCVCCLCTNVDIKGEGSLYAEKQRKDALMDTINEEDANTLIKRVELLEEEREQYDDDVLLTLAFASIDANLEHEANEALSLVENKTSEWYYLAKTLQYKRFSKDEPGKIVSLMYEAVRNKPEWAEGHLLLAVYSYEIGEKEDAEYYFKKALALSGEDAYSNYYLGIIESDKGNRDEAIELLELAKTQAPLDSWIIFYIEEDLQVLKNKEVAE